MDEKQMVEGENKMLRKELEFMKKIMVKGEGKQDEKTNGH